MVIIINKKMIFVISLVLAIILTLVFKFIFYEEKKS